ncbi:hypothetical protein ACHAXT_012998 [Thalassiosira profunda]
MDQQQPSAEEHPVVSDLCFHLQPKRSSTLPVAAIRVLLNVIRRSNAETMMGLQADLRDASDVMVAHIALSSGCELFLKYVTRASLETPDFTRCRALVLERGERSRVVEALLKRAALVENKRFRVIVLEGRPDAGGAKSAKTGSGEWGTVNKVGTFALGVMARNWACRSTAAESYKFTRLYPLNNADLPEMGSGSLQFLDTLAWGANDSNATSGSKEGDQSSANAGTTQLICPSVSIENPPRLHPAKYITLLFTDLGVLTPSAVSDELIRLYQ